ncbi:hypothetical protein RMATCC62417_01777 [Rhizopus microsporus]|nr:hypothetical protein RMATCC62417_01777 [Rhizopus microsporus]
MFLTEQRTVQYAVGSCEVKSSDNEDAMGTHEDLYRLAIFCKNAMDKGQIKAFMAIQVVGNDNGLNPSISILTNRCAVSIFQCPLKTWHHL